MVRLFDVEQVICVIENKKYGFDSKQVTCVIENKKYNFDRYSFETRSKEMSVTVDFGEDKISGDMIAYGEYGAVELKECIKLLKTLKPHEIKRDFSRLINQYKQ